MVKEMGKNFEACEVLEAIKNMSNMAAPGPDGIPDLFFKRFGEIIGNNVTHFILLILNNVGDPSCHNHTYINLTPKTKNPTSPSEFRSISLCNIMLKRTT